MLFLLFYSKISQFFEKCDLGLSDNYPNKEFIKRFARIY